MTGECPLPCPSPARGEGRGGARPPAVSGKRSACISFLAVVSLIVSAAQAAEWRLDGALTQGGLVRGAAVPGARITLDGKPVALAPDGGFVIGFGRDARPTATLAVTWPDGRRETRALAIAPRSYRIQRIDGLPERKVTPAPADLVRIRAESALLRKARERATPESWFRGGFVWPASGRISGIYGSQRILNGKPRRPHLGVDIAAPVGTPIVAAADGVVALAHADMFFTGRTLVLDHGLGLGSVYAHMSAVSVKPGDRVRRGQRVGAIGRSGRVTGPHLHWSLTWFDERLDPSLAVAPVPVALGAEVGPAGRR